MLPDWAVDILRAIEDYSPIGLFASLSGRDCDDNGNGGSSSSFGMPALEVDPLFEQISEGYQYIQDDSSSSPSGGSVLVQNNSSSNLAAIAAAAAAADDKGATDSATKPPQSATSEFHIFDSVFGVVESGIRERWRKQEREMIIRKDAESARRRKRTLPAVRYSRTVSISSSPSTIHKSAPSSSSLPPSTAIDSTPLRQTEIAGTLIKNKTK